MMNGTSKPILPLRSLGLQNGGPRGILTPLAPCEGTVLTDYTTQPKLVEPARVELAASSVQGRRITNNALAPKMESDAGLCTRACLGCNQMPYSLANRTKLVRRVDWDPTAYRLKADYS